MPLKNLRSTVSGHVPAALAEGQFGFNEADGILFVNNAAGQVVGYNLAALVAALTAPRSIATGGTGSTTAAQALAALGGQAAATAAQADDVRQLMIQMAMLRGKVTNYASGFADDYQDQSGVDTANSVNAVYDATNKLFISNPGGVEELAPMTSNTAPSGQTASATSAPFGAAYCVYDGSATSWWSGAVSSAQTIQRTTSTARTEMAYAITAEPNGVNGASATQCPVTWTRWGSNDGGTTRITLDTQTNVAAWSLGERRVYQVAAGKQAAYTTYGLTMTANGGDLNYYGFATLESLPVPGPIDLRSVAVPASIVPSKAGIFVLVKATSGIITPNTNLIASVSRTGSASPPTWTQVTLVAAGAVGGFTAYEANAVDISAQASGSSMRTRLQTTGSLAIAAQANVMQWAA